MHASGKLNQRRFSQFTRFKAIFKHSMTFPRKNELSEAFPLRSRPQKIFLQELFVNSFYRAKSGIIDSATNLQSAFGPNDLTCSSTTCKIPLRCFSERWLSPEVELTSFVKDIQNKPNDTPEAFRQFSYCSISSRKNRFGNSLPRFT
jgi:hypothetical protein